MPRSRPPYAPEFRRQMVELVRTGRSPEELSREFEPSAQAIRNWVVQAERDEGRPKGVSQVRYWPICSCTMCSILGWDDGFRPFGSSATPTISSATVAASGKHTF